MCPGSLVVEFKFFKGLPFNYTGFQLSDPNQWTHLPGAIYQGYRHIIQSEPATLWKISFDILLICTLSFGPRSQPDCISSLSTWLYVHPYYTIVYMGYFCQLPVSFQWVAPHVHIFWMCWWGLSPTLISSNFPIILLYYPTFLGVQPVWSMPHL